MASGGSGSDRHGRSGSDGRPGSGSGRRSRDDPGWRPEDDLTPAELERQRTIAAIKDSYLKKKVKSKRKSQLPYACVGEKKRGWGVGANLWLF